MKKYVFIMITCLTLQYGFTSGQTIKIPFDSERWNTQGAETSKETYLNKESLLIKSGAIFTKEAEFQDGILEADICFSQERSFPGFAFRLLDPNNFENFYLRPHQSGNPDATQYTPVFNGQAGWQLYYGEGYSREFSFTFNQWHHIKIEVTGTQAEIYIDNMQTPLIKVTELKREPKPGKIGLLSGGAPVRFANLQYTLKPTATPVSKPVPPTGTNGIITRWQVSNQVNRKLFEDKYVLNPEMIQSLKWTIQPSEPSGTINLSKHTKAGDTGNVMVAKIIIESASEQTKLISFGFSDYVIVYLNGKALFVGRDNFRSRDYRFLGTIGYFDALLLPLKKGNNELWFVLSEDFGGWGVQAKFEDMNGISLKDQ